MIHAGGTPIVQAIGGAAVNQAVKAIVFARAYLAGDGIGIACVPEFGVVVIDGQERTAIRLRLWRPGEALPPVPTMSRVPGRSEH